jgi:lipid-A-disaccharide synthase
MGAALRIAVVAGDAGGDLLGAQVLGALRKALPQVRLQGVGGPRMQAEGLQVLQPFEALAHGARGARAAAVRRELLQALLQDPPDVFVGVDAAYFNLSLEQALRARGVRTVHCAAPLSGGTGGGTVQALRRACDRVLCLLPFEAPLLAEAGVAATFVGHPLADQIPEVPNREAAREQFRLSTQQLVVALLPGGREKQLEQHADLFVQTAQLIQKQVRSVHFLVPLGSRATRAMFEDALYRSQAAELPVTILFGHAQMAMTAADGVLLAPGTAALEAALLKRTMVVAARGSDLQARLARGRRLPWAALPNVLAGRFLVPELLQADATPANLAQALLNQIGDKVVRARQEEVFLDLHRALRQDCGQRAVEVLLPMLAPGREVGAPRVMRATPA